MEDFDICSILTPTTLAAVGTIPLPMIPSDNDTMPNQEQSTAGPLIRELEETMFKCFDQLMARMRGVESQMTTIHSLIGPSQAPQTPPSFEDISQTIMTPCLMPAVAPSPPQSNPKYHVQLDGLTQSWYTERPFPPFTVRVINSETGEVAREANEWRLAIHLYDGYNRNDDSKLADEKSRFPFLTEGVCEVAGLRFLQVSSKNGGHFVLEIEVHSPEFSSRVVKARSQPISVMSCRLYNCRRKGAKLKTDEPTTQPQDKSFAHMPLLASDHNLAFLATKLPQQPANRVSDGVAQTSTKRPAEESDGIDIVKRPKLAPPKILSFSPDTTEDPLAFFNPNSLDNSQPAFISAGNNYFHDLGDLQF